MPKQAAGILVYRIKDDSYEVLLAHMGGPFHAKKDNGSWTIPKGEYEESDDPLEAAKREFREELGQDPPEGELLSLGSVQYKSGGKKGKIVHAWGIEGDLDVTDIQSNTFTIEWPPRSGRQQEFPEIDRAAWFDLSTAGPKLIAEQAEFLARLADKLDVDFVSEPTPVQPSLF